MHFYYRHSFSHFYVLDLLFISHSLVSHYILLPSLFSPSLLFLSPASFIPSPLFPSHALSPLPSPPSIFPSPLLFHSSSSASSFPFQTDATNANIVSQADSLNDDISSVNSSCYSTLDSVSQQIGSFEGLNFNAQLLNIGVFNSCVYEYLDECEMDLNTFNCSTEYFPVIVAVSHLYWFQYINHLVCIFYMSIIILYLSIYPLLIIVFASCINLSALSIYLLLC